MVKKLTFKNGLRLVLASQPASPATTVLVLVAAGSEYETKKINGISHFLEHLMFKGTAKRPKPGMISRELDALGAEYNAFTGQEYTGYWAKVERRKTLKILELVSDLYLNPIFNPEEIEKERGVVIEEINMYEDTPMRRVQEFFTSLLYGDQPAGWDIAGEKSVIRTLERKDFERYRARRYLAPATVVVVSGAFDEKKVTKAVHALFDGLKRTPVLKKPKTTESQQRPQVFVKFKESDQSHLVVGTRAIDIFDTRRYALELLSHVLGGGMSSRLFHRIREELGAAYYIRSFADLSLDHGYLSVSAGVDHRKIEIVIHAILDELTRLRRDLVPADELRKSKDHMIGNFVLSLETSDQLANFYGGQEVLLRAVKDPKAVIAKVEAVSAEEIRAVARSFFTDNRLNLAVIGPYKKAAPFKKLLRF